MGCSSFRSLNAGADSLVLWTPPAGASGVQPVEAAYASPYGTIYYYVLEIDLGEAPPAPPQRPPLPPPMPKPPAPLPTHRVMSADMQRRLRDFRVQIAACFDRLFLEGKAPSTGDNLVAAIQSSRAATLRA